MVMRRFGDCADRSQVQVLDYGCGGGNNFWFLMREGFSAHACDIADSALAMSRNRMIEENITLPEDRFRRLDGERLPYPDNFFSAIVDRESLCQSSWEEVQSRVKEFRRILAPGGWYLGINFSCHHPTVRDADYIGSGDWQNFREGVFQNQGQRHLFSVNDLAALFSEWRIDSIAEQNIRTVIGANDSLASSEYLIEVQKK
jgi:ubiquinone/menaquinone biosynthesis C-methylase UbiE